MVSLEDRLATEAQAQAHSELGRFKLLLQGGPVPASASRGLHEELLDALAARDSATFETITAKVAQRRISPDADWCRDDYLLVLLLLGEQLFAKPLPFLATLLDTRANNPNPLPRKINQVFSSLHGQDYDLGGELAYLKIPFLHLSGRLRLTANDAIEVLQAIAVPAVFKQFSPLLQLITERAYDLVLTQRTPLEAETTIQLVEAVQKHAPNLTLSQWRTIFGALRGRLIIVLLLSMAGLAVLPVLFGFGQKLAVSLRTPDVRVRPNHIGIAGWRGTGDLPREAVMISETMLRQASLAGLSTILVTIDAQPFATATPAFAIEASHPERPIVNAFAFTRPKPESDDEFLVVPVQKDGGRFRALIPEGAAGQKFSFVLQFQTMQGELARGIAERVVLRPLQ